MRFEEPKRFNVRKYVPHFIGFVFCSFFMFAMLTAASVNKRKYACQRIGNNFSNTRTYYDEHEKQCLGYIRGKLHIFTKEDDTIIIKQKEIKVKYVVE